MIELPKFKDEEWFVSNMKAYCVHGNTAPKNFDNAYDNSPKRKAMVKLITDVLPGFFSTTATDILSELITCSFDQLVEIKEKIDKNGYVFSDPDWINFTNAYESFVNKGHNI